MKGKVKRLSRTSRIWSRTGLKQKVLIRRKPTMHIRGLKFKLAIDMVPMDEK
jgi:hypothetical protein